MALLLIALMIPIAIFVIGYLFVPKIDLSKISNVETLLTWKEVLLCFLFGSPFKKLSADWEKNNPNLFLEETSFSISQQNVDEYNRALQTKGEAQAPALAEGVVPTGFLGMVAVRIIYMLIIHKVDFQHFHLLGLIARGVKVEVHKAMKIGTKYKMKAKSKPLKYVKRGIDLVGSATIYDDSGVVATLEFTGLKMMKHKKEVPPRPPKKEFDDSNKVKSFNWEIAASQPLDWLSISGDPNPIHLNPTLAKLFGMKSNIMHGTWMFAKSLSYFEREMAQGGKFMTEMKFINPMLLPATGKNAATLKWYKTDAEGTFDLVVWTKKRGEPVPACIGTYKKLGSQL